MNVLYHVELAGRFPATGRTRHYAGGRLLPAPHALHIARFEGESGVYLLYLDEDGEEQTDTFHDSVEDAMKQARFEFGVESGDWREA